MGGARHTIFLHPLFLLPPLTTMDENTQAVPMERREGLGLNPLGLNPFALKWLHAT